MEFNWTTTQVAIFASLVFVAVVLFQFFIMILMPPKEKDRK